MEEHELTTELVEEPIEGSVDVEEETSEQAMPYAVQPVAYNYYGHYGGHYGQYGYHDGRGGFWPILPFLFLVPFLFNNKQPQYVPYPQPYPQPYPYPAPYPYPGSGYPGR